MLEHIEPDRLRPLRRTEYDRLVELGVFEDERVELLRGYLVTMSPPGGRHAQVIRWLTETLVRSAPTHAQGQIQLPLALGDDSEPEPDVAVVPRADYALAHPTTALLIVEVTESQLAKDRQLKAQLYAEHAIPEYWVVNLKDDVVHVHTEPTADGYAQVRTVGVKDVLVPAALEGVAIRVGEMIPRRA